MGAQRVEETARPDLGGDGATPLTWQIWHVHAEAQRQLRAAGAPAEQGVRLVDLLGGEVLHRRSVSLARPNDGIAEPPVLRRSDGTSVYTVSGSDLFTSNRILDADQRLVATAGRRSGHTVCLR